MGVVSTVYVNFVQIPAVLVIVSLLLLAAGAGWTYVTLQNPYVRPLLKEGWSPLLGAMMICSGAGIVLDVFVSRYMDFGLLSVIVTS
jgi:solute carrier family 41